MIIVQNLPTNVKLTEIHLLFKKFGTINKLNLFWKKTKGKKLLC